MATCVLSASPSEFRCSAPAESVDANNMAAIIVASLLWLPSDCTARIVSVDAGPAEVESATETAASVASMATRKTPPASQFSVNMILPFSKSTIRYSYTEPTSSASSARTSAQTMDIDQAHSISVSPYGCGTANKRGDAGGQRKRKRVRWKSTTAFSAAEAAEYEQSDSVMMRVQTNTIVPLPGYPTAESGHGMVFEAAAEQLDQLYTVSRVANTVSGIGDDGEARGQGGTTDATEDSAVK